MRNIIKNIIAKIIVLALILANIVTINPITANAKKKVKTYKVTINATVNEWGEFKVGKKLTKYAKKGIDFEYDYKNKPFGCWADGCRATTFSIKTETENINDVLKRTNYKHKGIYYNETRTKKAIVTFKFKIKTAPANDVTTDDTKYAPYGRDARNRAFKTETEAEYYNKIVNFLKEKTKDLEACNAFLFGYKFKWLHNHAPHKYFVFKGDGAFPCNYNTKKMLILELYVEECMRYNRSDKPNNNTWEALWNGKFTGRCAEGAEATCCLARELGFEAYCVSAWDYYEDGSLEGGHGWCNVHLDTGLWYGLSGTSGAYSYRSEVFETFVTDRKYTRGWGDYGIPYDGLEGSRHAKEIARRHAIEAIITNEPECFTEFKVGYVD